ncbi:MAG: hypothetical protein JWO83_1695 [Caulobacteraceae bacterium]|jgi:hypothetical protein|nr:hypothetical protein [Caulobacteraceae bacterium]
MIGMAIALGLAADSPAVATDLATRMRESAAAAQALQGPLDGAWTLCDAHQQPLFVFQITDPVGGAGPLGGAWRRSGASAPAGLIDAIARRGGRLAFRFIGDGEVVRVRLRRRGDGAWAGAASENGHDLAVTLRPSASGVTPR